MHDLFEEAGSLGDAYRAVDWAGTALGPVSSWSPTLVATLRMAWRTRFAVTLMWGKEYVLAYNEAYVPMIADKHPSALGTPARDVFPEIWDIIGPMLDTAAADGGATWAGDLRLLMDRHGYLEETFFTFSYSAVAGADGQVEGVIDITAETTAQVVGNRRIRLLFRLTDALADVEHRADLIDRALPVLRAATEDLPSISLVVPVSPDTMPPAPAEETVSIVRGPDGTSVHIQLADPADGSDGSVLVAQLSPHLPVDDAYMGFLRLIGATLTQSLHRIRVRHSDRKLASMERAMSETLQRSLLAQTTQPEHLRVAVRYQSSIAQSHIGGDWYDAFTLPDGTLTVVVGDVSGHDRDAAAAMAQIRNLLRGIAYSIRTPPSRILDILSGAMTGLPVDAFATVVLAQIEPQPRAGSWTLRWSNAGHPPPVRLAPDGTVTLLTTPPDTLLGTRAPVARGDHETTLEPGTTVVLYTDGLIERRGTTLDEGLDQLAAALTGRQDLDAEQLSDYLLDTFAGSAEDDIALTVLRA